ncbi:methionyl-tRNA formyltransferase [Salidesulfovibrio brasiliensis]|uniref:methionyl-tRNA formyltransferase n=1 Tax=Salidesulfovibrio brasiliensis TaxID=221711 RepID=UPI0006D2A018|nr:methionyl-tRNA formyltransferase [Salidesulfovibrio brasiliensis]
MSGIGLMLCGARGEAVLRAVLKTGTPVAGVLVLEQQPHEIDDRTGTILDICREGGIRCRTTAEVKPSGYEAFLRDIDADAVVVVSWRYLIPESCFGVPTHGIYVLHDSLLPKYRGFAPTNWVIINGEAETGVTLMHIAMVVDAGDVVDQRRVDILPEDNAASLGARLTDLYPRMVVDNLKAMLSGTCPRIPQDHTQATYACKRTPEDGRLDFTRGAGEIVRLVRGLTYPYPGAFCEYEGERIIIWKAEVADEVPEYVGRVPGRVIGFEPDGCVLVLAGEGAVRIRAVARVSAPETFLEPKDIFTSLAGTLC